MLILNDEQRLLAGMGSMSERCKYCSKAFAKYPLVMSDDVDRTVYHVACALQLATDILVDLCSPTLYHRLKPLETLRKRGKLTFGIVCFDALILFKDYSSLRLPRHR